MKSPIPQQRLAVFGLFVFPAALLYPDGVVYSFLDGAGWGHPSPFILLLPLSIYWLTYERILYRPIRVVPPLETSIGLRDGGAILPRFGHFACIARAPTTEHGSPAAVDELHQNQGIPAVLLPTGPGLIVRSLAMAGTIGVGASFLPESYQLEIETETKFLLLKQLPAALMVALLLCTFGYRCLRLGVEGIKVGGRTIAWTDIADVEARGAWLTVTTRTKRRLRARLLSVGGPRQVADMAKELILDGPRRFLPSLGIDVSASETGERSDARV